MSRSYKKSPVFKDCGHEEKKFANRKVRRYKNELSNGNAYRKLYPQWDICDWLFRETKSELISGVESDKKRHVNGERYYYRLKEDDLDLNKKLNHWAKFFYRK